MKIIVTALVALLFIGGHAKAFTNGNDLLTACSSRATEHACVMYIRGVGNTISLQMEYTRNAYALQNNISSGVADIPLAVGVMCHEAPSGATTGQVGDVVTKYLEAHPETRHFGATWLAWPCTGEVQS
jgi:hypothetical protein